MDVDGVDSVDLYKSMDNDFVKATGPQKFSYSELVYATNGFSDQNRLGEGAFGAVYKGFLKELNCYVAVKRVSRDSKQGIKEYAYEVKIISQLRHKNIVKLIGWCHEENELLLIYEFLVNGSLDTHLFREDSLLTWDLRYKIALGLASGLLYLQEESEQYVVHRDIKAANIMLDSDFNPKFGDFGLARLAAQGECLEYTSLAGTIGYVSPEYATTGRATKESDVFSFGVVALEIACGRKIINRKVKEDQINLREWVWDLYGEQKLLEAVDPRLNGDFDEKQVCCLMQVGLWCAHPDSKLRPTIEKAIHVLNFVAPLPLLPSKMPFFSYFDPISMSSSSASGITQLVERESQALVERGNHAPNSHENIQAVESDSQELELDLSSLSTVNTMFVALFSKLGVPIKTTVSATLLEEALSGMVTIRPLLLGENVSKKVEKQCAHFYSVTITEEEASAGFVCRVQSFDKSKFKLLYFDKEENGGLSLALQEDSARTGKITSAGMYFLGFPVYRLDQTVNSIAVAKDADAAFFKKLDGFQQCEITELKGGTHVFAVYGDNFFKSASYSIEAVCAAPFTEEKENLGAVEADILTKRVEVSKFETEYREVLAQFTEMTGRYAQEMQEIDELLKQRNEIHAAYTVAPPMKRSASRNRSKGTPRENKEDVQLRDKKPSMRDRSKKKKWFRETGVRKRSGSTSI